MEPTEMQAPELGESSNREAKGENLLDSDPALLARTEIVPGKYPGHERVRIVRPGHTLLQRVGEGVLQATVEADAPEDGIGRIFYNIKRTLIGAPIANAQAEHERLTKFKALAVLS